MCACMLWVGAHACVEASFMLAVLVWSPTCFESSLSLSLQFIDSAYPANLGIP